LRKKLLDSEDTDLPDCVKVVDPKQWPEDVGSRVTYGETDIRELSQIFRLSEREMIRCFREFLEEKKNSLKCDLDSIAISSSECERGFSQMNLIVTPSKASLLTKTTLALLFVIIVGPLLMQFNPIKS
jgi:hypothetical protein